MTNRTAIANFLLTLLGAVQGADVTSGVNLTTTNTNSINNNDDNGNFKLNIVHINDHHSHLGEETFLIPESKLPSVEKDKDRRVFIGGFPRLVRMFRQAKEASPNTLKLHAGDALIGTAFFRLYGNDPDVAMMHEVCFDAFNLGNHEFDYGDAQLADFLRKLIAADSPCQNTRVLSANLVPGNSSELHPLHRDGYIAPFTIRNFENGHRVAIIGINIRNKTLDNSSPDVGTNYLDEKQAIRNQVAALTKLGINKIVLLSHMGYTRDIRWMAKIEGVDVGTCTFVYYVCLLDGCCASGSSVVLLYYLTAVSLVVSRNAGLTH